MDAAFEEAVDIVARLSKSGPVQTSYDEKLLLYALFKQAVEGPPRTARPGVLDLLGRAKYDAWKRKEGLSAHEAKRGYVEALKKILRSYGDKAEAVDYARQLDQLLNHGDPRDLVISDSDVSSEEEERRTYQPPPPRARQSTQTSSQASSSRGYVSAPLTASRSQSSKSLTQKRGQSARQQAVREDEDTASSASDPVSPPVTASSRDRMPPSSQRQQPAIQPRYAPSASGSAYGTNRAPISTYNPSNAPPLQSGYGRPPSVGPMPRSPLAQPPIMTPGPDIEGLRQKLSALEAFLTQPDVPEDRKRQVEIEIAKTRGYLAVISQRFNTMTPTSGITLSELQARQQQTIQRMTPGALSHAPASNLERALDNIQTSLTALNERLSRLEARPATPRPPARLPIVELLQRLLFFLHLRETPRGLQSWSWLSFLTTLRGAMTDFAFFAFLIGLAYSVRQHGLGWRAIRETWYRVLLLGATQEVAGRMNRPLEM